jgi:O-antigen/teichoic acid export membrane protein
MTAGSTVRLGHAAPGQTNRTLAGRRLPALCNFSSGAGAPAQSRQLTVNFGWTLAGNVTYALSQWGILVALAKLGNPAMVGQFALGLAIAAPVFLFGNLQLRSVLATDARREFAFGEYLATRLAGMALAFVTVLTIAVSFYGRTDILVILCVAAAKSVDSLSDIVYGLWQQQERMDLIARSLMIRGVAGLVLLAVAVGVTGSIACGAAAMALVWLAVLLGHDLARARAALAAGSFDFPSLVGTVWRCGKLIGLLRLAFPLGVVMLLLSLNTNIPRYFIERQFGARELGVFAALACMMTAGTLIVGALGQSATARLAAHYAASRMSDYRKLVLALAVTGIALGGAAVVVSVLFGRRLLALMYTDDYAEHADLLVWIMVAAGFSYVASCLGYAITSARRFAIQIVLYGTATAATAVLCAILIPSRGLVGAAQALVAGGAVQVVASVLMLRRLCWKKSERD